MRLPKPLVVSITSQLTAHRCASSPSTAMMLGAREPLFARLSFDDRKPITLLCVPLSLLWPLQLPWPIRRCGCRSAYVKRREIQSSVQARQVCTSQAFAIVSSSAVALEHLPCVAPASLKNGQVVRACVRERFTGRSHGFYALTRHTPR